MNEITEIDGCRKAFELWYANEWPYANSATQGRLFYESWQAAWQAHEQQTAVAMQEAVEALERAMISQHVYNIVDHVSKALAQLKALMAGVDATPKRESSGVHGYEISDNTIYIGPMRPDRVKVADITCTIDWDETYTEEAKARRLRNAERICRGLDRD